LEIIATDIGQGPGHCHQGRHSTRQGGDQPVTFTNTHARVYDTTKPALNQNMCNISPPSSVKYNTFYHFWRFRHLSRHGHYGQTQLSSMPTPSMINPSSRHSTMLDMAKTQHTRAPGHGAIVDIQPGMTCAYVYPHRRTHALAYTTISLVLNRHMNPP
jgi:hypothetical protein